MRSKAIAIVLALGGLPCFAQSDGLQIVSPRNGTVVHPGETVTIAVRADRPVSNIAIMGEDPLGFSQRTNGQGLQFLLTIPSNTTLGAYQVSAMGSGDNGSLVVSAPVSLQVDIPKARFKIQTEPSVLRFDAPGETMPLHVIGAFGDGSKIDMTHSLQMSYSSQNPQVASVDDQCIVTALAPGSTRIVVNNGTYSYFVDTRVGLPGSKFPGANKSPSVREETKGSNESPPPKPIPPAVFILSSGERIESSNYLLTVDSLVVEQSGSQRTIPMSTVDLTATMAANRERGIDLQIPTRKSQILVSF